MNRLEKAKEIIRENINDARCGIFDTRNIAGDRMSTIYDEDYDLQIDICYRWEYFEVFGLSDDEFNELEEFYYKLKKEV